MNNLTKQSIIKRYGSWDKYVESARKSGAKGGSAKVSKGFATLTKDQLKEISAKGGRSKK